MADGERSVSAGRDIKDSVIITGDGNRVEIRQNVLPITPFQLRAPVGDFVGREKEIETLTAALRNDASASISGISGMGGIGKTELALLVANQLRDYYPGAQLFVDMRGTDPTPRDPADALASCIRAFVGVEVPLPDTVEDLINLYRSSLNNKRVLVVLDNTSDDAQARPFLPPLSCALLITSRNALTAPGIKRIRLDQLEPSEARELLTRIAPRIEPDIADQICSLCGYLPLAIRAAGSLLDVSEDLDPTAYASELRNERTRLERIGEEGVDVGVEASFRLSYHRLDPETQRVFRGLAAFPASFDSGAETFVCEDDGHKHLSSLLRRSLIIFDDDSQRYRLHDLVRLFAVSLDDGDNYSSSTRHTVFYGHLLWLLSDFYKQGGDSIALGLTMFDREWDNIRAGQAWAMTHSAADGDAAALCIDYPNAAADLLLLRRHPRIQIDWLQAALTASRRLKMKDAECGALNNLGMSYEHLTDYSHAIECFEHALHIYGEIGDRKGEGAVLGNLGCIYGNLGQPQRAIEYLERALAIDREICNKRGEGQDLNNLGSTYLEIGEIPQAIECFEQAMKIVRETGAKIEEVRILGGLGKAYAALKQIDRAIEFFDQQQSIARQFGDLVGYGSALCSLGTANFELGDSQRALEYYRRSLAVFRECGSIKSECDTLWNMCQVLNQLGDRANALKYGEESLGIFEKADHPKARIVRRLLEEWRGEQ